MEKDRKPEKEKIKIGEPGYLNQNCWLVKSLNYPPYKRCQYCGLKFHNCLFLHYQIISLILIIFFLALSFLIKRDSELVIISVFTLIIIYGYFFNKSTDRIIETNFTQRKAEESALREKISREEAEKLAIQERALRQRAEKLAKEFKRIAQIKDQMLLSSQHYWRTPLTGIIGYLEMILEGMYGKLSPELREKLVLTQNLSQELHKRIEESIDITQFQIGKGVLKKKEVQLEDLIKKTLKIFQLQLQQKDLYLKREFPKEPLPKIRLDPKRILEVLSNLIDNAIKHTEKGGITLGLQLLQESLKLPKEKPSILFFVRDTGIGIPPEEIAYIGQTLFERGKTARELSSMGKGIGLYLSNLIVQAHGGKLWAESEGLGKGSTFFVELPIK